MSVSRRLVCLVFAGIVLIGTACARPDLFDLGFGQAAEAQRCEQQAVARGAHLERETEAVIRRMAAKDVVIKDLVKGHLTLLEAARWFKQIGTAPDECPENYSTNDPGLSENECCCRQVLLWVQAELENGPRSQAEMLLCRLEEELRVHLERNNGVVIFPEE